MLRKTVGGIQAGILIAIGGTVFLACCNDGQKLPGAILFSVALLCICAKEYLLFTGKVGFLPEAHGKAEITTVLAALLGNTIATVLCGLLIRFALPKTGDRAELLCRSKLEQSFWQTLILAVFCGILMYLAVCIFRDRKSYIGILFCIPVFILSGFEHSIADLFYFAASGIVQWKAFGFLWTVILGNALGGVLLPLLSLLRAEPSEREGAVSPAGEAVREEDAAV